MNLIMDDTCDHFGRKTLKRAFELICARLGIADYNRTVHLNFAGPDVIEGDGHMCPTDNPAKVALSGKPPNNYQIELLYGNKFSRTIAVLAHELTHVAQYIRGELSVAIDWKHPWKRKAVQLYMGCRTDGLPYQHRPWEQEAFAKMDDLAKHAILTMEREGVIRRK